jgi:hypothetical protein
MKDDKLLVFKAKDSEKIIGPKKDEVNENCMILHVAELRCLHMLHVIEGQ